MNVDGSQSAVCVGPSGLLCSVVLRDSRYNPCRSSNRELQPRSARLHRTGHGRECPGITVWGDAEPCFRW